jgi:DNA-binding beta-propeller fold protein YncE
MASIVDRIPFSGPVFSFQLLDGALFCMGDPITRISLPDTSLHPIAPGMVGTWSTVVDFHRPIDGAEDILGTGAPDRRIFVVCFEDSGQDGGIGDILPVQGNRFMWNRAYESDSAGTDRLPAFYSIAGTPSAKVLYLYNVDASTIDVVDLDYPRHYVVASIGVDFYVPNMVVSPDDRFIYAADPNNDAVRVIDTASFPPPIKKVRVGNGPYGLALSKSGQRLFITESNWSSTSSVGGLRVLDTESMQGPRIDLGGQVFDVALSADETRAYVPCSTAHSVSVVDVSGSPVVTETVTGFQYPGAVRLSGDGRQLYVLHYPTPNKAEIAIVAL